MKLGLIDRAIAAVAPEMAARRLRARFQIEATQASSNAFSALSGVDNGNVAGGAPLLRWWRPGVRDAAGDSLPVMNMQRGQSRDLARTQPLAAGAIQTNVDRTVGTGLALVAQPNATVLGWSREQVLKWKNQVQTEFSLFADSKECDIAGEQDFYEKQGLTLRSALESGDCFTLMPDAEANASPTMPYRLRLQTLEADRCGNPGGRGDTIEVAGGIRRKSGGAAADGYFIYDRHPGSIFTGPGSRFSGVWVDRIGSSGRRRILHHFRQLRPEQPRGIPYLAPVVELFKQLGRYTEAEIQAAIVSAFFTVIVETETGASPAPIFAGGTQEEADAQVAINPEISLGPAAVIGLAKGEKASFANPTRPNTAFGPFIEALMMQGGVGLFIGKQLLTKQFDTSYTAARAALLDAFFWFRGQRTWLARSLCQPVYETWMAEAVAIGRIAAPGFFTDPLLRWAYTRAAWHGDSQGSINPKDEVAAYLAAVEGRIMTRERAEWELSGTDWYETFASKQTEQELLKAADLLPVPKAGAPAPASTAESTTPTESEKAFASMAASVAIMASRESVAPVHNITMPPIEVNNTLPQITVEGHDISVTLPDGCIQLEAHIEQPAITVNAGAVHVPEAQVVVHTMQQGTRQAVKRNAEGDIVEIETVPLG
jgi:lambda family phage portal protein